VYLDNSPICEGDYKSAQIARDYYAQAKNASPAEQEHLLQQGFGALRTTHEAFVIYDLFNGVVKRFEERVGFDQLKDVVLDHAVVEQVVEKLGALSRYIDAHLHSDIFAAGKPTPQKLLEEINAFEELRKRHRDSKRATPVPATTAATTRSAELEPAAETAAKEASNLVVGEFDVPDTLREDLIDIVIIDLDRMALEHRPALVGNLIPSAPPWCLSDVTDARNLIPGLTKEAMDTKPSLVIFKARDKPIRIGPVGLVVVDKAE
jgi:hypothetical protein